MSVLLAALAPVRAPVTEAFNTRLFVLAPALRDALGGPSGTRQRLALLAALWPCEGDPSPETMTELAHLARDLRATGVRTVDLETAAEALDWALADALGMWFVGPTREQTRAHATMVVAVMRRAYERAT